MAQNQDHGQGNLDTTDSARAIALQVKAAAYGLQDSEKEELKQLKDKGRNPNKK